MLGEIHLTILPNIDWTVNFHPIGRKHRTCIIIYQLSKFIYIVISSLVPMTFHDFSSLFISYIRYIPLDIPTLMALMGVVLEIPGGAGTPGA